MRLLFVAALGLCLPSSLAAQSAPRAPQLSPQAAYEDAMRPLDATRRSIANWSDAEIDALKVAIARAAAACAARDVAGFSGAALIDYARLCALGQAWPAVVDAAGRYISATATDKPLLVQAYAARLDGELRLKNEPDALADALAMLKAVPYDTLVAQAVDEAVDYMELAHAADALTLEAARQPFLLKKFSEAPVAGAKPGTPAQTLHELYAEGMLYASIQQLTNQPEAAAATVAALDAALPAKLPADELVPITAARKRYSFLGRPLPGIAVREVLSLPHRLPELPAPRAVTALLLFPDWCTQCVRMGKDFPPSVFEVEGHEAYLYGLMADTLPPAVKVTTAPGDAPPKPSPKEFLAETPTILVPPSVLTQFAGEDFPLLILTDSHGIVRIVQSVSQDVLQPGGSMDTAVGLVGRTWPLNPPKPATPAAP